MTPSAVCTPGSRVLLRLLCFLCRDINTMMCWAQQKAAALLCPGPQDSEGPVCPPGASGNLAGCPLAPSARGLQNYKLWKNFSSYQNNRGPCARLCGRELVLQQATMHLLVRGAQQGQEWHQSVQLQNIAMGQDPVGPVFASRHSHSLPQPEQAPRRGEPRGVEWTPPALTPMPMASSSVCFRKTLFSPGNQHLIHRLAQ